MRQNRIVLFTLLIIFMTSLHVNSQHWEWSEVLVSDGISSVQDVCTDDEGNTYLTGYYEDTATFFGINLSYAYALFMIKLDSTESPVLTRTIAGGFSPNKIAVDPFGSIYIIGVYIGTFQFAGSWHSGNWYLLKYDAQGNEEWAITTNATIRDIDISDNGKVGICGSQGFGASLGTQQLNPYCGSDFYVAQIDSSGSIDWVYGVGSNNHELGYSCTYVGNHIVATGTYRDTLQVLNQTWVADSSHIFDMFILKMSSTGTPLWVNNIPYFIAPRSIVSLADNSVVMCALGGDPSGSVSFGNIAVNTMPGYNNLFMVCYNETGAPLWVQSGFSDNSIYINDAEVNSNDDVWIAGRCKGDELHVDGYIHPVDSTNFTGIPILMKIRKNGDLAEILDIRQGGVDSQIKMGVAVDKNDDVYLSGSFGLFDLHLGNDTVLSMAAPWGHDGYIAKYDDVESQNIEINQGWNIISSYIAPTDLALVNILSAINSVVDIVKNGQGDVYWPLYNINQIGSWDIRSGYQIKVSDSTLFNLKGALINPYYLTYSVNQGWDIISYIRYKPMAIDAVFGQFAGSIVIIKDGNGQVYWPQWNINIIGDLLPGQGYHIKASTGFSLTYPEN